MPAARWTYVVYDRIPHSAYEAHNALGDRASMALDTRTRLVRVGAGRIAMRYGTRRENDMDIVRWYPDGAVMVYPPTGSRMGPAYRRIACALPDGWQVDVGRRTSDGRIRRPRLVYREAYWVDMQNIMFRADGGIQWSATPGDPEFLPLADLDREASTIEGFSTPRSRRRPRAVASLRRPVMFRGMFMNPDAALLTDIDVSAIVAAGVVPTWDEIRAQLHPESER